MSHRHSTTRTLAPLRRSSTLSLGTLKRNFERVRFKLMHTRLTRQVLPLRHLLRAHTKTTKRAAHNSRLLHRGLQTGSIHFRVVRVTPLPSQLGQIPSRLLPPSRRSRPCRRRVRRRTRPIRPPLRRRAAGELARAVARAQGITALRTRAASRDRTAYTALTREHCESKDWCREGRSRRIAI